MRSYYQQQIDTLEVLLSALKRKDKLFLSLKLTAFLLSVFFIILYFWQIKELWTLLAALALFILYLIIYRSDSKNTEQIRFMRERIKNNQREIDYGEGRFEQLDNGADFRNARHPFSLDMDIFGEKSLFQRICRTVTTGGRAMLASWLQNLSDNPEEVMERREAINELAAKDEWRNVFFSLTEKIDSNALMRVIQSLQIKRSAFSSLWVLLAVGLLVGLFFVSVISSFFSIVDGSIPLLLFFVQVAVTLTFTSKRIGKINRSISNMHASLKSYSTLTDHLEGEAFHSKLNSGLHERLFADGRNAQKAFRELSALSDAMDRRNTIVGLLFFNGAVCNDFFLIRKAERWLDTYSDCLSTWNDAISEMDALSSMATFRFNHPEAKDAVIVDEDKIIYRARGLYHPFLPCGKAVGNDFEIQDFHMYIITGANMAGKSTFLRSLGVNYILALSGLPVFATSMEVSLFALFSGMRTDDSLSGGISYFHAELLRLEELVGFCKRHRRTLIILDEILRGTNSADKLSGSKLFLEAITKLPVSGIIATHDLALSRLEEENGSVFSNYCFEIELSATVVYTYKIQRGVAKNMNASFLLKNMLSKMDSL